MRYKDTDSDKLMDEKLSIGVPDQSKNWTGFYHFPTLLEKENVLVGYIQTYILWMSILHELTTGTSFVFNPSVVQNIEAA